MLWRRAGGRCEQCGRELEDGWHAHHKYPWTFTRRTTINEMQALCPECNLKLGDRMELYDETGLRLGQQDALRTILRRLSEGCSHTAIVMATRYGKSDLQRIAAMAAFELRLACCAVSLSPTDFLVDQINSTTKWAKMCERVKLAISPKHTRISAAVMKPNINGEHFISVTMQFFQGKNLEFWKDWARDERRRTGLPVLLFVDECHTNSTMNEWGKAVTEWQKYTGGHVVLLTATAERADDQRIPGFEYSLDNVEEIFVVKTRPGSQPERIRVDVYDAKKAVLNLVPHENISFGQAWREEVLCHVEYLPFDVDLNAILAGDVTRGMLNAITNQQEIRRALSRCIRHPIVMRGACDLGLARLRSFRLVDKSCGVIIFCGNDDREIDPEFNRHARQIKQIINQIDASLKVVIATSKNEGKAELEVFAAGQGDVLIVKQMAGLGLDVSRLKVGIDLSPVRTKASVIQRMMRIATPHEIPGQNKNLLVCVWITPADLLMQAIYQSVVVANGGQATTMDLELLRSYEKDREEGPEKPEYIATGTKGIGASDTRGNKVSEGDLDQYAKETLETFPELGAFLTQPQIVERQKARSQQQQASIPQSISAQVQDLRNEINAIAKQVINSRMAGTYNKNTYPDLAKEIWTLAKQACGIPLKWSLEQINDLKLLTQLRDVFLQMLRS
jgi:superfamily II DNA or RNA helicase